MDAIDMYAFGWSPSLTCVQYRSARDEIGSGAFTHDKALETVDLAGKGVLTAIGPMAFSGRTSLKSIRLRVSVH